MLHLKLYQQQLFSHLIRQKCQDYILSWVVLRNCDRPQTGLYGPLVELTSIYDYDWTLYKSYRGTHIHMRSQSHASVFSIFFYEF